MRRIVLILLCIFMLALPGAATAETVPAASGGMITSYEMEAVVSAQGTAQVNATVNLHITESATRLVIPLGKGASNCVVSGVRQRIRKENGVPCVILRNETGLIGDVQLSITYQLSGCVSPEGILSLPILANSYVYPIDEVSFRITLPGEFTANPIFQSGYLGEDIDNYMDITVEGPVIQGKVLQSLRDHDSLSMTLETPEELFPRRTLDGAILRAVNLAVLVLAALMVLYWALRLFWKPVRIPFQSHPPMGETAGESWALLTGGNLSFSLMVITWAQMGYLTIRRDRDVVLYRRMDMGNERSELEIRAFSQLFRKRRTVSATGADFQRLRARMDGQRPHIRGLFSPRSGNPMVLRVLGLALGLAAGLGLGDGVLPVMQVRFLPLILFALGGAWGAWAIQGGIFAFLSRDKSPIFRGGAASALLLILGLLGGRLSLALMCLMMEVLTGLVTLFGGRRTEDGRGVVQGELGMVRFFRREYKERHQTAQQQNPSYYYDLAPYALALGADKAFARRFDRMELPPCSWLQYRAAGPTAADWQRVLRDTVDLMDGKPIGLERTFPGRVLVAILLARQESKRNAARRRRRPRTRAPQRDPDLDRTRRIDYSRTSYKK